MEWGKGWRWGSEAACCCRDRLVEGRYLIKKPYFHKFFFSNYCRCFVLEQKSVHFPINYLFQIQFSKSWLSMTAMGSVSMEQQLLELFPHIEEDFLLGLYDAYKEENPDLDEMVEIVFSYDHPPLKKLINDTNRLQTEECEDMQARSDNLNVEVDSKIVVDRALKEDELMVSSLMVDNINIESFDNNRITETITHLVVNDILESPDIKRDHVLSKPEEVNQIKNEYPEIFNVSIGQEDDEKENISEHEVKLLFFELPFRNDSDLQIKKRMLYSTNEIQSKVIPEDKESLNDELNSEVTSTPLVSNAESNVNNSFVSKSKISQADSRSDEEPCTSNSGCIPVLIPNHSETTALYTSSLTAYDPPETCTTALSDGLEIVHEKQTNPICVTELGFKDIRPSDSPFNTPESKCSLLHKIFPDADSEYLLCQSKNFANSDELLLFISKKIDDKMYPKRRVSEESTPEVLGFDCTVEQFLQYIPDPTAEFQSDQYVRTDYKENAEIYLKSR